LKVEQFHLFQHDVLDEHDEQFLREWQLFIKEFFIFQNLLFLFYLLINFNEVLVKSAIPLAGRPTRPRKPLPRPLTNPLPPPSFAPVTGFLTTPLTPDIIS
jgi:hypothetical protein